MTRRTREDRYEAERRQAMRDLTRAAYGGDAGNPLGATRASFENWKREARETAKDPKKYLRIFHRGQKSKMTKMNWLALAFLGAFLAYFVSKLL